MDELGFPVTDWTWQVVLVGVVGSLSWRQRLPEMKFPADPESRRACTEMEMSKTVNCTTAVSGCIFM